MPEENITGETPNASPTEVPTPAGDNPQSGNPTGETWKDGKPFNAEAALQLIDKLRKDEGAALELAKLKTDQQAAEEERKRKQGEFKNLYETEKQTAASKAAELESATAKLARANEILGSDIDKRIEKWPDEIKNLIPNGEGVDALTRFEKVSELAPLADRLMNVPARPGNSAGPTPSGGPGVDLQKKTSEAVARNLHGVF